MSLFPVIRRATEADLKNIYAIESAVQESPWLEAAFADFQADDEVYFFVVEGASGKPEAFIIAVSGDDFLEKGIGLTQPAGQETQQQTAQTGTQAIPPAAAEEDRKAAGDQNMTQKIHGDAVMLLLLPGLLHPDKGGFPIRLLGTDPPAEIAETLHSFQIGTQMLHTAQLGDGCTAGDHDGDDQTMGNGVYPGLQTVGGGDALYALLDPVGLRAGHGKPGTHGRYQLHQLFVVHNSTFLGNGCKRVNKELTNTKTYCILL